MAKYTLMTHFRPGLNHNTMFDSSCQEQIQSLPPRYTNQLHIDLATLDSTHDISSPREELHGI